MFFSRVVRVPKISSEPFEQGLPPQRHLHPRRYDSLATSEV
jgi:hypothetical protein